MRSRMSYRKTNLFSEQTSQFLSPAGAVSVMAGVLSLLTAAVYPIVGVAEVLVDGSVRYQTMDGFGSSERVFDDPHFFSNFNGNRDRRPNQNRRMPQSRFDDGRSADDACASLHNSAHAIAEAIWAIGCERCALPGSLCDRWHELPREIESLNAELALHWSRLDGNAEGVPYD